jgi:hypothetical protein
MYPAWLIGSRAVALMGNHVKSPPRVRDLVFVRAVVAMRGSGLVYLWRPICRRLPMSRHSCGLQVRY